MLKTLLMKVYSARVRRVVWGGLVGRVFKIGIKNETTF